MELVKVSFCMSHNRLMLMLVLNRVSSPRSATMERILTLSTTMKNPRFDKSSLLIGRERPRICVLLDR